MVLFVYYLTFYTENVSVYLLFLFVFVSVFWHCEILSIALFLVYIFLDFTYIGVDFALKVINWDPDTLIRLQLWDIAGNMYSIADNILHRMSGKHVGWLEQTCFSPQGSKIFSMQILGAFLGGDLVKDQLSKITWMVSCQSLCPEDDSVAKSLPRALLIHDQFLWYIMVQYKYSHWSWSRSTQRKCVVLLTDMVTWSII